MRQTSIVAAHPFLMTTEASKSMKILQPTAKINPSTETTTQQETWSSRKHVKQKKPCSAQARASLIALSTSKTRLLNQIEVFRLLRRCLLKPYQRNSMQPLTEPKKLKSL